MSKVDNKEADKELISKLGIAFTPIDNKVLVKPMEAIKIEQVTEEPVTPPDHKTKTLREIERGKKAKVKTVKKVVKASVRRGVVLAVPKAISEGDERFPFEVGDVVIFPERAMSAKFELYKDSVLLSQYDILGIWDMNKAKDKDVYGLIHTNDSKGPAKK